jgi:single-strand selective monofunctional uracil DNA glycosylase
VDSKGHAVTAAAREVVRAAELLRDGVAPLRFSAPVAHVYNPLDYAWLPHKQYAERYATGRRRVLFLGMNPGPFGMAQTGVPFGEIPAVRDWLGIRAAVKRPPNEHPARPVLGFDCPRCEVSGQRLWGLFAARFGTAEAFFAEHFVVNYCPLVFMEESGRNVTPDKLPKREAEALFRVCDEHLTGVLKALEPEWLVGIGGFAFERLENAQEQFPAMRLVQVLHPSPASPAANRDWAGAVSRQLEAAGVWPRR